MSKLLPIKKYLQITVVLALFFALVQLRQLFGLGADTPVMGNTPMTTPGQNNIVQQSPGYDPQNYGSAPVSIIATPASYIVPTATPTEVAFNNPTPSDTPAGALHVPRPTAVPSVVVASTPVPTPTPRTSQYKDGTFTGTVEDAYYGNVQVQLAISNGKITAVNFLQYPNDNGTSRYINGQAMPALQAEVIQAQNGHVDAFSGASETSRAFLSSIQSALQQASAA